MMVWLNEILRATRSALSRAARTWLGRVALGVIVLATLATAAFLNPIRASYSPKAPTESIAYDEQISIPKVAGGPSSMNPVPNTLGGYAVSDQAWLPSGWTPLENGNGPGQLLVDVATVRLWRKRVVPVHSEAPHGTRIEISRSLMN
jgi:hypothetical protein